MGIVDTIFVDLVHNTHDQTLKLMSLNQLYPANVMSDFVWNLFFEVLAKWAGILIKFFQNFSLRTGIVDLTSLPEIRQ